MRFLAFVTLLFGALGPAAAAPLPLTYKTIADFGAAEPGANAPLQFLGGLDVSSSNLNFGGLSGIDMLDAETAFIVGDTGNYLRARLVHEGGRLTGLANGEINALFPGDGVGKAVGDIEDVALDPADRSRGVIVRERQANAMLGFDLADEGPENFKPMTVGADNRLLRSNRGLESVAYAPKGSPLAGKIVAIAEHPPRHETDIPAWIVSVGSFKIARHDDFDISSARFLPDGDLVILERRYSPLWGVAMRLRRIQGDTIKVDATVDGETLIEASMTSPIDNMEGLAVSTGADGRTILTIVSDDNFSVLQRTLILQFALVGG